MKYIEIIFWKIAIKIIKNSYSCDCEIKDTDDIECLKGARLNDIARCPSCSAKEVVEWIENHIKLIKY